MDVTFNQIHPSQELCFAKENGLSSKLVRGVSFAVAMGSAVVAPYVSAGDVTTGGTADPTVSAATLKAGQNAYSTGVDVGGYVIAVVAGMALFGLVIGIVKMMGR
jgi:hypothetical protein